MRLGPFPPMQVIEAETRAQQAERSMHAAQSELESRRGSIHAATAKMERSDAAATERGVALAAAEREAARAVQGMEAAEARERTLTLTLTLALALVAGGAAQDGRVKGGAGGQHRECTVDVLPVGLRGGGVSRDLLALGGPLTLTLTLTLTPIP